MVTGQPCAAFVFTADRSLIAYKSAAERVVHPAKWIGNRRRDSRPLFHLESTGGFHSLFGRGSADIGNRASVVHSRRKVSARVRGFANLAYKAAWGKYFAVRRGLSRA